MNKEKSNILFIAILCFFFGWAAWEAYNFAELASFFPFYVSLFGLLIGVIQLIISVVKLGRKTSSDQTEEDVNILGSLKYMGWVIGYIVLIIVIGFLPATVVFLAAFLFIVSKMKWYKIILSIVLTLTVIALISNMLTIYWPTGIF